jgi:DNA-directed RNA polymerase subunit M/transcription elongation factor TFIIS
MDMKIKFWQFEYDFDREDAKIVVPIALLLITISVTSINPLWLLATIAAYYLLYFFIGDAAKAVRAYIAKRKMRCPHCKNRKIILQGYQAYKSDEHYPYYFCESCETTSILTDGGLLKIGQTL